MRENSQFKNLVRKWCEESTTHGLVKISDNKQHWLMRIVWLLSFLAGLTYCSYLIVLTLIDYMSYPVTTNIQVYVEQPTQLPAIMICNLSPFRSVGTEFLSQIGINNISNNLTFDDYFTVTSKKVKTVLLFSNSSLKQLLATQLQDMLISCKFTYGDCGINDFEYVYVYDFNLCYTFNPKGTKYIGKSGLPYGLTLELYVGSPSDLDRFSDRRGIRFIAYNYTIENPFIKNYGYDAAPGFVANVNIKKYLYSNLGRPYSDCIDDLLSSYPNKSPLMAIMFNQLNQTQYSQIFCQNLCLQKALNNACGCYDPSQPSLYRNYTGSVCNNSSQVICYVSLIQNFSSNPNTYCLDYCPRECSYTSYEIDLSFSEHSTVWSWDYQRNFFTNISAKILSNQTSAEDKSKLRLYQSLSRLTRGILTNFC